MMQRCIWWVVQLTLVKTCVAGEEVHWLEVGRESHVSAHGLAYDFVKLQKTTEESIMSDHGFHVHGPHDHELEHAGQGGHGHGESSMTNQIAMFTAIIATVGAIFGYMAGATQANAGLYKNNAAIKKTEASNQWNYYQAKSSKQNLSELALELAPASKKEFYESEIKRYKAEKADIKLGAEKLEAEAKAWDRMMTLRDRADAEPTPAEAATA